jgi:hypothetical protein
MSALNNAELLSLWEDGCGLHPLDRGVLVVHALLTELPTESVADWTLGRRNEALAQLHSDCFGPALQGWTECAKCGETLEFCVDCRSLMERQRAGSDEPILMHGRRFRVPTSRDQARIAGERDPESAAMRLLEACRVETDDLREQPEPLPDWSAGDLERLGEKMIAADPLAEIVLSFECPVCREVREQALDLVEFLWAGLEAAAKRLLGEVHLLASAYGWNEAEILALSESRRSMYVAMVQG